MDITRELYDIETSCWAQMKENWLGDTDVINWNF